METARSMATEQLYSNLSRLQASLFYFIEIENGKGWGERLKKVGKKDVY